MSDAAEEYVPLEGEVTVYGDMPEPEAVTEDGQTYDSVYLPSSTELIEEQKKSKKYPIERPGSAALYVQGRQKKTRFVRKSYASTKTTQRELPTSVEYEEPQQVTQVGPRPEYAVPLETEQLTVVEPNIVARQVRMTEYHTEKKKNITIASGDFEEIVSQTEDGELVSVSVAMSDPAGIAEIAVFGDTDTYIELNIQDVDELIAEGAGLTPADVRLLPSGESPDRPGHNDGVSVYVARYKADAINTWKLNGVATTSPCYVVKYKPLLPFPYKAISVNCRNNSGSTMTMFAGRVTRIIHTVHEFEVHEPTKVSRINERI